jgi:hypothetical protein
MDIPAAGYSGGGDLPEPEAFPWAFSEYRSAKGSSKGAVQKAQLTG